METEKTLIFKLKKEEISPLIERISKEYQKNVKIQGFRPGKAPIEIVKAKYKKEIEEDSLEEYIREKVLEEVKKENSKLASPIYIKDKKISGDEFEITVSFEILPSFDVRGFENIKVEKRIRRASPDEIEKRLKKYQESLAELRDKEEGVKEGDFIVLKYNVNDISGREVLKDKTESFRFIRGNIPEEFYREIEGKKRGEHFKVARNEKNGTFIYEGNILSVKEVILPPIDDEFARMFEMESLEDFKKKIGEEIAEDLKREAEEEFENKILEELSRINKVPVPRYYVEEELRGIISRYGLKEEEVNERFEEFYKVAEEKIRRRLLLERLAEQLKIEVKKEEIEEEIKRLARDYRMDFEVLKKRLEERNVLIEIEYSIKRKRAMEFLKNNVKMEVIIE
ncbi:MAG: trigger factor [candidate division WOR-3 bacterium]